LKRDAEEFCARLQHSVSWRAWRGHLIPYALHAFRAFSDAFTALENLGAKVIIKVIILDCPPAELRLLTDEADKAFAKAIQESTKAASRAMKRRWYRGMATVLVTGKVAY
jgi:hypothetical protein